MKNPSHDLLQEYIERGSDAAFATLHAQHVDSVHARATKVLSQEDNHLADDVTQSVFRKLSNNAATVMRQCVVGWLSKATYLTACQFFRAETRRRLRESKAAAMHPTTTEETQSAWQQMVPLLETLLLELPVAYREVLLLHYYQNKTFPEIASALRISKRHAQRRARRGIERLRKLFAERGVSVSASALSAALAANAVQAAPAALATGLASTLATQATLSTTATITNTIAMTVLHKIIITTSAVGLSVGVGLGLQGVHEKKLRRADAAASAQREAALADRADALGKELEQSRRAVTALTEESRRQAAVNIELLRLRGENTQLRDALNAQKAAATPMEKSWRERSDQLRARVNQTPAAQVPELQLATEADWLDASKRALNSEDDYRRAMSSLRTMVERKLLGPLSSALKRYRAASNGQFPTTVEQLAVYFDPPVDPALLARWKVMPAQKIVDVDEEGLPTIMQTPVDMEFDRQWCLSSNGYGSYPARQQQKMEAKGE